MKRNNLNRWISLILASIMCISLFTGCAGHGKLGNLLGVTNNETQDAESKNENKNDEATNQQNAAMEELQAQLDAANKALAEANASNKELQNTNAILNAELNAKSNPFTFDDEGKPVSINFEDAEKLLRVEMENGTYAYRIGKGTPIDVIDEVVLKNGKPYAEQTFELAHHKSSVYVIVGVDSKGNTQVLQMVYGSKLYAYNKAWAQPKAGEGFELMETKKVFKGSDIALVFANAICVYEDANSEWGYSLCLNTTGEYVAPSKPSTPAPKPEVETPKDEKPIEKPEDKPEDKPVEKPEDKPIVKPENKPENNPDPEKPEYNEPENNPPIEEGAESDPDAPADQVEAENNEKVEEDENPSDFSDVVVTPPQDMVDETNVDNNGGNNPPPAEDDCNNVITSSNVESSPAPVEVDNYVENNPVENEVAYEENLPGDMQ